MTDEALSRDDIVARATSEFAFLDEVAARPVEVDDGAWSTVLFADCQCPTRTGRGQMGTR